MEELRLDLLSRVRQLAVNHAGNLVESYEKLVEFAKKHLPDKFYLEDANRAVKKGEITPENLEPNPKNPIIASFFRNIGRADRLGSGVRNLYKYYKLYSGQEPKFIKELINQLSNKA